MLESIWSKQVQDVFEESREQANNGSTKNVKVDGKIVPIPQPFPSPVDWRDNWIYFLMIDRFNNPKASPKHKSWDEAFSTFQGGNLKGIRAQLPYFQEMGVKAIWISPIFKNCSYNDFSYHGYGIQDFLSVDPRFGTEKDLLDLTSETHARGMYIILDIVLNHAGDVFDYEGYGPEAPWNDHEYKIKWRNEKGAPNPVWEEAPKKDYSADAAIWPSDLSDNKFFRRHGRGGELGGDFCSLKEMVTEFEEFSPEHGHYFPVRDLLIRAFQYWIAKADIDGYRIDTLKYISPKFARVFGNAMREFAMSIGKKNFFTFGEVYDDEWKIAEFIGRDASRPDQLTGVDAALDFPLFYKLPSMVKGWLAPSEIVKMYQHRRDVQKNVLSSRGEASRFFVTFLDNHDQKSRFYFHEPGGDSRYDAQVSMGLGCLFSLQGIPCMYYGTEQGLHGSGDSDSFVREALWGKQNPFDHGHPFYNTTKKLSELRDDHPALRYGRQYFRPISGNGAEFGISPYSQGILAFSRILNDTEIVVIMNTHTTESRQVDVIVDFALNPSNSTYRTLFSNLDSNLLLQVMEKSGGSVTIHETDGNNSYGPARVLPVNLKPMEIQILGK
jgi:glycosidase